MIKITYPESLEIIYGDGEVRLNIPKEKHIGNSVNDIQLTKNFNLREFASKDTGEVKIHPDLVRKLQKMRDLIGKPIYINSGYRTRAHNKQVGGANTSQHLEGTAADIQVQEYSGNQLAKIAEQAGFKSIGIARNWIHVDTRLEHRRWTY